MNSATGDSIVATPAGFYRRTKNNTGEVAVRADRLDPGWRQRGLGRDDVLARASAELLREDWLKQAVLTLAFPRTWQLLTHPPS